MRFHALAVVVYAQQTNQQINNFGNAPVGVQSSTFIFRITFSISRLV